jgi:hypothetical protein
MRNILNLPITRNENFVEELDLFVIVLYSKSSWRW